MPKNKKGGSKFKKSKKPVQFEEKLILAQDNEHYAKITKVYGSGRFGLNLISKSNNDDNVQIVTTKEYMGILPGRMRRQKWKNFISVNDIVLIALRDFQTDDTKVDILHKYKEESTKKLEQMRLIPDINNYQLDDDCHTIETDNNIESNADSNNWEEEFDDI
tara:strand:- start:919 stop:1404 length:486 start_codon:yes stop_codon:yes gene_type:complete